MDKITPENCEPENCPHKRVRVETYKQKVLAAKSRTVKLTARLARRPFTDRNKFFDLKTVKTVLAMSNEEFVQVMK